ALPVSLLIARLVSVFRPRTPKSAEKLLPYLVLTPKASKPLLNRYFAPSLALPLAQSKPSITLSLDHFAPFLTPDAVALAPFLMPPFVFLYAFLNFLPIPKASDGTITLFILGG